jgi:hypothetical protein
MSFRARGSRVLTVGLLGALALAASLGASFRAEAKHKTKAPVEAVDCKTDADCVAVPDDCCPCAEGGKQRAIPKKERATYEKDRHKRCAGTMCTEAVSQDPSCAQQAFCGAGICELRDSSTDSAP